MALYLFETPLGRMGLMSHGADIVRLFLPNSPTPRMASMATPLLEAGRKQLLEYMAGERKVFDLPLAPQGTPFQEKVWRALTEIPWGETRSYGDIARAVDNPKGYRAVGMANNRNPIPILIPCHRVVGADGSMTGYGGGLELKQALLTLEGNKIS